MRDGAGQYGKDTMNDTIDPRAGAWDGAAARRRLDADGFCLVPGVLDPGSLRATREMAGAALASVGADHRAQWKSQGSLIAVSDHPSFAALIAHPGFQDMFRHLGFGGTLFSSGYVISKPAGRAGALLAPGLVGLAARDLAGRAHRPDRALPLPDGYDAGERLPAADPRLPSACASAP